MPVVLGALALVSVPGLPTGAASSCTYDAATATARVQMLSPRTVSRRSGSQIFVDGQDCGALASTRRIVVASAFGPVADTVVVDESHGRLVGDVAVGPGRADDLHRVAAGAGEYEDLRAVGGAPVNDALGASIDLDGDSAPDFVSTDVGRIVLFGRGGDDRLLASSGPDDRVSVTVELHGGPGRDVLRGGRSGHDRLDGGQP
jgi:hypothetical protein